LLGFLPWATLPPIFIANGLPEMGAAALITVVVVAAWKKIAVGKRKGSDL